MASDSAVRTARVVLSGISKHEAAVLSRLAAGVRLEVHGEALHASPREVLTEQTRNLIRQHKGALVALLSASNPVPHRQWLIRQRDGSLASHSFCPPATRAEVCGWHPGSAIEVEQGADDTSPEPESATPCRDHRRVAS